MSEGAEPGSHALEVQHEQSRRIRLTFAQSSGWLRNDFTGGPTGIRLREDLSLGLETIT
jgi:hypothetical protein